MKGLWTTVNTKNDIKFKATAILKTRSIEGVWTNSSVVIESVEGIKNLFKNGNPTQVNLSKFLKVYYSVDDISDYGCIVAKTIDMSGETCFMGAPLLFVECDDAKPIDITEEALLKFEEKVSLL